VPNSTTDVVPFAIHQANAARRYYALDRQIRRALESLAPPSTAHRRALAALLLDGIEK